MYNEHKKILIDKLTSVQWASCTADLWSAHKRAYLGITVHFIDDKTFEMHSAVLACRRFRGSHTGVAIGRMLANILKEFGIAKKVLNIVTDNAANFAKAFALFSATTTDTNGDDIELSDTDNNAEGDNEDNEVSTNDERLNILDLAGLLDNIDDTNVNDDNEEYEPIILPQHKRCGNHSLNLVASVDARKAREDKSFQRAQDRAMGKVQALSNAVNRSTNHNDTVEKITGTTFLKPICVRWCSEFYAVERVVKIGLEKVSECQRAIKLPLMTDADMSFLTSFIAVMKPLVWAMDFLQRESSCFIGHLIPTIKGIQRKLNQNTDRAMEPLTEALLDGIETRFSPVLANQEYCLATMLIPKFRLSCISDEDRLQRREQLLHYVQRTQREVEPVPVNPPLTRLDHLPSTSAAANDENLGSYDLFDFLQQSDTGSNTSNVIDQVNGYLTSTLTSNEIFQQYPAVGIAFKKCNATLPSSATVERLFSAAAQILTKRRCRMSDSNFDRLVFLRYSLKKITMVDSVL
jgi:hypothetical protein